MKKNDLSRLRRDCLPACGQGMFRLHDKRAASSIDVNNVRRPKFGTRIAHQHDETAGPGFRTFRFLGDVMTVIVTVARKWVRWYRVLRYHKAFSFGDSVRYGLWLSLS
jgi:hypothetical protein